jgi:beta-lactamase class C
MDAGRESLNLAAAGCVGLFIALGPAVDAMAQTAASRPSSCSPGFMSKANAALEGYRGKSGAPGVAVAFFDNGNACVLVGGVKGGLAAGPVTAKTNFAMGSVQKVFNSTLLAYQIAQGKAAVDDPAAKYLVAANGARILPGSAFSRITLRHLATHTASLPEGQPNAQERDGWSLYRDRPMPPSVMAFLNSWKPPYPPGTRYNYSNIGFVVMAYAATTLSDRPYTEFLSEALTRPIGMTHTGRALCDLPSPSCASGHVEDGRSAAATPVGLWTTADDMLLFIEANLGALKLPDPQARAIRLAHEELFRLNKDHAVGMAWEAWHSGDALLLSKNGEDSGFTSWVAFEPNRHRGVAVLSNGAGKPPPANLGLELLALAAEH